MKTVVEAFAAWLKKTKAGEVRSFLLALMNNFVQDAEDEAPRIAKMTVDAGKLFPDAVLTRLTKGHEFQVWANKYFEDVMYNANPRETVTLERLTVDISDGALAVTGRYFGASQSPDTEVPVEHSTTEIAGRLKGMGAKKPAVDWKIAKVGEGYDSDYHTVYTFSAVFPMKDLLKSVFSDDEVVQAAKRALSTMKEQLVLAGVSPSRSDWKLNS